MAKIRVNAQAAHLALTSVKLAASFPIRAEFDTLMLLFQSNFSTGTGGV